MAVRPLRFCDVCGQEDDHPRHVSATAVRHLDCCAETGCQVCALSEIENTNGMQRAALLDFVLVRYPRPGLSSIGPSCLLTKLVCSSADKASRLMSARARANGEMSPRFKEKNGKFCLAML